MKLVSIQNLKNHLNTNELPKLSVIISDDAYLLKQCENLCINKIDISNPQLNLLQLDGRTKLPVDTALEFISTFPFMSDTKLLIIRDFILSTENIDKTSLEKLIDTLKNADDSSKCIITIQSSEANSKGTSGNRAKKILEIFDKLGLVIDAPILSRADFINTLTAMATERGCTLSKPAGGLLFEYFSGRLTESVLELEKLCNYRQNGEIDEDTVKLLVTPTPEARVFAVCDMLMNRQLGSAQLELGKLFFHRQTPESISQIICMTLSDIYLASLAQDTGKAQTQAANELGYYGGSAYRLKKQWTLAKRLGSKKLLHALRHAVAIDMKMKQSGTYSDILLEAELVELYNILWKQKPEDII